MRRKSLLFQNDQTKMKLYYLKPFVMETYGALTPDNIREFGRKLLVTHPRDVEAVHRFVRSSSATRGRVRFDPENTRLLVEEAGQPHVFVGFVA